MRSVVSNTAVDHDGRLRLLTALSTNRKATRAARDYYDAILTHHGTDPASLVAAAARAVYGLHEAGAIDDRDASVKLAALLDAWRACRFYRGARGPA
jgi:hypothetical protein